MKNISVLFLIFICCNGLFYFCSSRPKWIEEPYKEYDPSKYIVGVGFGSSINQSDDTARQEIIKQIKVQIRSRFEQTAKMEIKYGSEVNIEEKVLGRIEGVVEGKIEDIQIIQRYEDKGMWYSLAVFDKAEYSKKIRRKLTEKELEISKVLKSVEDDISNGEIFNSIQKLKETKRKYAELESDIVLLYSISGGTFSSFQEIIDKKIDSLKDVITIRPESDNLVIPEPATNLYFQVKVITKSGQPAKNIPLIAKFDGPIFGSEILQTTDGNGIANFSFPILTFQKNRIEIKSGIPELKSSANIYVSPSERKTFKVSSDSEAIKNFISACLSNFGFEFSSNAPYTIRVIPSAKIESVGKDFKGNSIYIINISADISVLKENENVLKAVKNSKGGGSTAKEAIEQAFRNLLSSICKDVQPLAPDEYITKMVKQ